MYVPLDGSVSLISHLNDSKFSTADSGIVISLVV
nr:MAG TPA: hypothetical protein [Caudoviricetes sp.]